MQARLSLIRTSLAPGVLGGVVAGTTLLLYQIVALVYVAHATGVTALLQYTASGLIGKSAAYAGEGTAWLGLAVHYVVAAAWGMAYAYAAQSTPQLTRRPITSGLVYGFVVFIIMQVLLVGAGVYVQPTTFTLLSGILGHCVFFGLPLALVVRARARS